MTIYRTLLACLLAVSLPGEYKRVEASAQPTKDIGTDVTEKVEDLRKLLYNLDPAYRTKAANALAKLGPAAKAAVPDLLKVGLNPTDESSKAEFSSVAALRAVAAIGPVAIPQALEAYKKADSGRRGMLLAEVLGPLYREGDRTLEKLFLEGLTDRAETVRNGAIAACSSKVPVKSAIPILVKIFEDETVPLASRDNVAKSFQSFGRAAEAATPVLLRVLQDPKSGNAIRASAAEGLAGVGVHTVENANLMRRLLKDEKQDVSVRGHATRALGRSSEFGQAGVPDLLDVLRKTPREQGSLRFFIFDALAQLRLPKEATPALLEMALDRGSGEAHLALRALGKTANARAVGPRILKALREEGLWLEVIYGGTRGPGEWAPAFEGLFGRSEAISILNDAAGREDDSRIKTWLLDVARHLK
jgi:HEAT repeat protein